MKVLITGNAGSGKSSVAAELIHQGYKAVDADEGFGYWIHKKTKEVRKSRPAANRGDYYWVWNIIKISDFLKEQSPTDIFFCGIATNQAEVYKDFDKIIWLDCDLKVIETRLRDRDNNPFGKRPGDIDLVHKTQNSLWHELQNLDVIKVNADQPIHKVVDEIIKVANEN